MATKKTCYIEVDGTTRRLRFAGSTVKDLQSEAEKLFEDYLSRDKEVHMLHVLDQENKVYYQPTDMDDLEQTPIQIKLILRPKKRIKFIPLCGMDSQDESNEPDGATPNSTAPGAAAVVATDKIWTGREVLKVYFMDPCSLSTWNLTPAKIIEWANVWHQHEKIPEFISIDTASDADIRVHCSDKEGGSWSKVGKDASEVDISKPTMLLNLMDYKEMLKDSTNKPDIITDFQRSLVIHEFGHALGMEHEHQRSDFWDVVKEFIDIKEMEDTVQNSKSKKGERALNRNWFERSSSTSDHTTKYDSKSIMHYWFHQDWLKNPNHRTLRGVRDDKKLNKDQRTYLKGYLERTATEPLAKKPSELDFKALEEVYALG